MKQQKDKRFWKAVTFVLVLTALTTSLVVKVFTSRFLSVSTRESNELIISSVQDSVGSQLGTYLLGKTQVMDAMQYALTTGWYSDIMDADRFEILASPVFANQDDLLALYCANSDNNVMKFSHEIEGQFFTESREYNSNVTLQRRRRRVRFDTQSLDQYNQTEWDYRTYDPTARSWYILGETTTSGGPPAWQGPSLQTADALGDTSRAVFSMVFRVDRGDLGFAVFRLKFLVTAFESILSNQRVGDNGRVYVTSEDGTIIGAENFDEALSVDPVTGETTFRHIQELEGFETLSEVDWTTGIYAKRTETHEFSVINLDATGWRLVIKLTNDDFLKDSKALIDVVSALSIISVLMLTLDLGKLLTVIVIKTAHAAQQRSKTKGRYDAEKVVPVKVAEKKRPTATSVDSADVDSNDEIVPPQAS